MGKFGEDLGVSCLIKRALDDLNTPQSSQLISYASNVSAHAANHGFLRLCSWDLSLLKDDFLNYLRQILIGNDDLQCILSCLIQLQFGVYDLRMSPFDTCHNCLIVYSFQLDIVSLIAASFFKIVKTSIYLFKERNTLPEVGSFKVIICPSNCIVCNSLLLVDASFAVSFAPSMVIYISLLGISAIILCQIYKLIFQQSQIMAQAGCNVFTAGTRVNVLFCSYFNADEPNTLNVIVQPDHQCLRCLQFFKQTINVTVTSIFQIDSETPFSSFLYLLVNNKQQQMSSRYQKLDPVMLYQQQKIHYQHIIHPRATLKVEEPQKRKVSLQSRNKSTFQKQRIRKLQNKKMLQSLLGIYNSSKPGILSRPPEDVRHSSIDKRRTLYSSYKKQLEDKEIQKGNMTIFYHLKNAGPQVGNHKDWDKHYSQHVQMEKRLCKRRNNDSFNIREFRESLTREKQKKWSKQITKEPDTLVTEEKVNTIEGKKRKKTKLRKKDLEQVEKPLKIEQITLTTA